MTQFKFVMLGILCCLFCSCSIVQQGEEHYVVKELAPDGAWTWFNDERAIVDDTTLLIGSIDSKGQSRVDVYDMRTGQTRAFPLSSWYSQDDHNNPALLKMSNGQILACYAKHSVEPRWYCRIAQSVQGSSKNDSYEWLPEQVMNLPANATYNNVFELSDENGQIYNFMRCVGWNPTMLKTDDFGKTWSQPLELIHSGDNRTRPYVKYSSNGKDRIDMIYTEGHPRDLAENNVYHIYYQKGDLHRTDGTIIRSLEDIRQNPITPKQGTMIYSAAEAGRGWVWDMEYDSKGNPVAAFINSADHAIGNDLRYRYGRWDDKKEWVQQQIAYAGTHLYRREEHYAGGISIDPEDVDTVYISCDVDPATGMQNQSGRYQIFEGRTRDQGKTWKWRQLTHDTDVDNIRPIVPRDHGCRKCVIWLQGRYATYTDYTTKIVGIIKR
jgi:hypothetical protein